MVILSTTMVDGSSTKTVRSRDGHTLPVLMLVLTLFVFGTVVALVTLSLRHEVRSQILHRESEALHSAAMLQRDLIDEEEAELNLGHDDYALYSIILRTSAMRGVIAMRVFESNGLFFDSVPIEVTDTDLSVDVVERLAKEGPSAVLHEAYDLEKLFLDPLDQASGAAPLLQVLLPLTHRGEAREVGIAEMWLDGQAVKAEFDQLDGNLMRQAGLAFGAGAILILVGLGWTFRRLEQANRQLTSRTAELTRANADLVLAAKTSAIGAVTSHLIHGLKNPLAGLESLVDPVTPGSGQSEELREAASAARRMRTIVDEVVSILREEETGTHYELPVAEVLALVVQRVMGRADSRGVSVVHRGGEKGSFSNREANLVGLILVNLVENAIDVSQPGQEVTVEALVYEREIEFLVEDDGPGLPDAVKANLFQPVRSSKEGGSGIGLALSHQLAASLGGDLELMERSGPIGTRFKLTVPIVVATL